jgi:hypothetical protein
VSDDRFGDLGHEPENGDARSVGDRLADRDLTHPEPMRRPEVPRPGNKYAWLVGILALMGLSVLLFTTTLPNSGEGLRGPEPGSWLKAFAAPSARGNLEGEPNVCQRKKDCNKTSGNTPACEVRGEGVINVCELRRRPLILTFVFDRGADCLPQVDRTERVRDDVQGVGFATVFFSHKDRDELRRIVEGRRWKQPVAVDDGAVANVYGVGGCPTTVFARAGGKVLETKLGNLTERELRDEAQRLVR